MTDPSRIIAFQGAPGAYSEIAARKYFKEKVSPDPSYSFQEVFEKIRLKKVSFGIVPIENSLYGGVFETYDLLSKYSPDLFITGELNLQINHCLMSDNKIRLNLIKKIYSHPQALGQCSEFLGRLKNCEIIPAYDTAGSAKMLDGSIVPSAAIASGEAARIYVLQIIRKDIQNNKFNFTRFLIIGRKSRTKKLNTAKTSIAFELKSIPGALFRALSVFALRDIDLLKIESRPIPHKPFQYIFYVDFVGSQNDDKIVKAIANLEEISLDIKKFGSYEPGRTCTS